MGDYVYIDGAYFRQVIEEMEKRYATSIQLDHGVFFRQFEKKFYYDCLPPRRKSESQEDWKTRTANTQALFDELQETPGFHVHLGHTAGEGERARQKGVDVQLAVHMLSSAHKGISKRMTLLAGDADFVPLVDAVGFEGIYVTLWCYKRNTSRELRRAVDQHIFLAIPAFRDALKNPAQASLPVMTGQREPQTEQFSLIRCIHAGHTPGELYEGSGRALLIFKRNDYFFHISGSDSTKVLAYFEDECGPLT